MGLVTYLLFKPFKLLLNPIKAIYLVGGAIALAGVLTATWAGDFELFGLMMGFALLWSFFYSAFC